MTRPKKSAEKQIELVKFGDFVSATERYRTSEQSFLRLNRAKISAIICQKTKDAVVIEDACFGPLINCPPGPYLTLTQVIY